MLLVTAWIEFEICECTTHPPSPHTHTPTYTHIHVRGSDRLAIMADHMGGNYNAVGHTHGQRLPSSRRGHKGVPLGKGNKCRGRVVLARNFCDWVQFDDKLPGNPKRQGNSLNCFIGHQVPRPTAWQGHGGRGRGTGEVAPGLVRSGRALRL